MAGSPDVKASDGQPGIELALLLDSGVVEFENVVY
jgi:hypothetical protein